MAVKNLGHVKNYQNWYGCRNLQELRMCYFITVILIFLFESTILKIVDYGCN